MRGLEREARLDAEDAPDGRGEVVAGGVVADRERGPAALVEARTRAAAAAYLPKTRAQPAGGAGGRAAASAANAAA